MWNKHSAARLWAPLKKRIRQDPKAFSYEALNPAKHEIRLVYLQPRSHNEGAEEEEDASIECNIVTVDLDSHPVFEALSYEWGPRESRMLPITLNGWPWLVRENLWWAMYHLQREDDVPRVLWIDAICINQAHTAERNHQVAQMKEIYSSATGVVAWLGRVESQTENSSHDEIDLVMSYLGELSQILKHLDDSPSLRLPAYPTLLNEMRPNARWDAVNRFCARTYWDRLWIFQELVLAKEITVQCGKSTLSWEILSTVCNYYQKLSVRGTGSLSVVITNELVNSSPCRIDVVRRGNIIPSLLQKAFTFDLVYLVYFFRYSECENTYDKVFGLLGLCEECCLKANPADYEMTALDIAIRMCKHQKEAHAGSPYFIQDAISVLGLSRQKAAEIFRDS